MTPTALLLKATARGVPFDATPGGGRPEYTAADVAIAAKGVPVREFNALLYRYAGYDGVRSRLMGELIVEADTLRQREQWPKRVCGRKYLERLCELVLVEERTLVPFRTATHRAAYLEVSDRTWRRRLAKPHGSLVTSFDLWCSDAGFTMARRLRELHPEAAA